MEDGFLESHREEYERRKAAWFKEEPSLSSAGRQADSREARRRGTISMKPYIIIRYHIVETYNITKAEE